MDPLTIVGLASNIIDFINFTSKFVKAVKELRNSSNTGENTVLLNVTEKVQKIGEDIEDGLKKISEDGVQLSRKDEDLRELAESCSKLASELLGILKSCGMVAGESPTNWLRAKKGLRSLLKKSEIEEISRRLQFYQDQMVFLGLFKLVELGPSLATKSDLARLTEQATTQNSLPSCACCESRLHYRHISQASAVHKEPEGLRLNQTTPSMASTLPSSLESDGNARIDVRNGAFMAHSAQVNLSAQQFTQSLRESIEPQFREYASKIIQQSRKEIRGTIREEMEDVFPIFLRSVWQDIYTNPDFERQGRGPHKSGKSVSTTSMTSSFNAMELSVSRDFTEGSFTSASLRASTIRREDEPPMSQVFWSKNWVKFTKFGVCQVFIRKRTIFTARGPSRKCFECNIVLLPSYGWLGSGISLNYSCNMGPRGMPTISTNLEPFTIIPDDHIVEDCIKTGAVEEFQDMLVSGVVCPGDRFENGDTLLHRAAAHCRFDICQSLVFSGVNVRTRNCYGWTALDAVTATDIGINCLMRGFDDKQRIFRYLQPLLRGDDFDQSTAVEMLNIQLGNIANYPQLMSHDSVSRFRDWVSMVKNSDPESETWDGLLRKLLCYTLNQLNCERREARWPWLKELIKCFLDAGLDPNGESKSDSILHHVIVQDLVVWINGTDNCSHCEKYPEIKSNPTMVICASVTQMLLEHGADISGTKYDRGTIIDDLTLRDGAWLWSLILDMIGIDHAKVFQEHEDKKRASCVVNTALEDVPTGAITQRRAYTIDE